MINKRYVSESELFDFTTMSWLTGPTLPVSFFFPAAAALNATSVVVMGWNSYAPQNPVTSTFLYDFVAGIWTQTNTMNVPRTYFRSGSLRMDGAFTNLCQSGAIEDQRKC